MSDLSGRLDKAQEVLRELGNGGQSEVELVTVNVVFEETFYLPSGGKCERTLPATYDENAPYGKPFYHTELKRWMRWRVRYPLEETSDHGVLDDGEVAR